MWSASFSRSAPATGMSARCLSSRVSAWTKASRLRTSTRMSPGTNRTSCVLVDDRADGRSSPPSVAATRRASRAGGAVSATASKGAVQSSSSSAALLSDHLPYVDGTGLAQARRLVNDCRLAAQPATVVGFGRRHGRRHPARRRSTGRRRAAVPARSAGRPLSPCARRFASPPRSAPAARPGTNRSIASRLPPRTACASSRRAPLPAKKSSASARITLHWPALVSCASSTRMWSMPWSSL